MQWSFVKVLLVLLNVVSTILTLTTGLWYTPVVTTITGRYDYLRWRLSSGSINWEIVEPTHFRLQALASPLKLAHYEMMVAPRLDPTSYGKYRSVCTNINTMSAPVLVSYFDDFWGKGPRRVQTNVYSISAPNCDVVTVTHAWRDQCVADYDGNATRCHQYVLDHFDDLLKDKSARAYAVDEFGSRGVPFMRCLSRPLEAFSFIADLLTYESMWAGSEDQVIILSSNCLAEPLAQSPNQSATLFQAVNLDEGADMSVLLPPDGWFSFLILWVHSIATVIVVSHGMILALLHSSSARYLPEGVRFGDKHKWVKYVIPFMPLQINLSDNERAVITFKGALFIASDVWKTHWMYMWVSVLDGLAHLRKVYVTFQLASNLRFTPETFIYLCGAITKITWVMCFVETLLRFIVKLFARCLRSLRIVSESTCTRVGWDIDGISMFLSWRIFNLLLSLIVFIFFQFKDTPTLMVPANPPRVGAYGGTVKIASFWGSELACDTVVMLSILTISGNLVGMVLVTCTNYKWRSIENQLANSNSVMRLLGDRYWLSGWDGLMAADMLGLDPTHKDFLHDGFGYTKLSIGTLLTLMYQSGPSGFVHLAGDYIFHDGGFSKDAARFRYTIPKAFSMGLIRANNGAQVTTQSSTPVSPHPGPSTAIEAHPKSESSAGKYEAASSVGGEVGGRSEQSEQAVSTSVVKRSIFDRHLRVVSEGYLGKLLLVDAAQPGMTVTNAMTSRREFEVIDALTLISILDIKWIFGCKKKIRVR